jgi:hypothetical protein
MRTDVEAARPRSDGADVSHRRRPAGPQRALHRRQRPLMKALPRRDPGRMRLRRRIRWGTLVGGTFRAAVEPIAVA